MPAFIAQLDSAFQPVSHPTRALWRDSDRRRNCMRWDCNKKFDHIDCAKRIFDGAFVRLWHQFASLPKSAEVGSAPPRLSVRYRVTAWSATGSTCRAQSATAADQINR